MSDDEEADMRLRNAVAAVLALALWSGAPASAQDRGHHRPGPDFVPVHRLSGVTGGELMGQWWAHITEIPNAQNPLGAGTESLCLALGRHGNVVAPTPAAPSLTATCQVGRHEKVFLSFVSADCTSNDPDPFHGDTEAEQRACAIGWVQSAPITAINLSLDGRPSVNILSPEFFVVSPQMSAVYPTDPLGGATAGPTTLVGAGYAAQPRHLRAGRHVIAAVFDLTEGEPPVTITLTLDVNRHRHGR